MYFFLGAKEKLKLTNYAGERGRNRDGGRAGK
jgi:hypothetical protein